MLELVSFISTTPTLDGGQCRLSLFVVFCCLSLFVIGHCLSLFVVGRWSLLVVVCRFLLFVVGHFYRTGVRSLGMLVTNSLTHSLTH